MSTTQHAPPAPDAPPPGNRKLIALALVSVFSPCSACWPGA